MREEEKSKSGCSESNGESTVQKGTMNESIKRGLSEAISDAKREIRLPRNTVEDDTK